MNEESLPKLDTLSKKPSHATHAVSSTKKGLFWSFMLTGVFFAIELVVGLRINSVAVIADAAHNFSAAAGVGIALLATIFASKLPSPKRTFGFLRVEMFAAWINGILLAAMAFLILQKGISSLLDPKPIDTMPMIVLSIIGLIVGGIPAIILFKKQRTDINVRGAFWHVMETVFGSTAVLAAALVIRFTGWLQADAVFGMLLAPVLILAAWNIIMESTRSLLDLTPKDVDLVKIKRSIEKLNKVVNTHHLHVWTLTTNKNIFSAHVKVTNNANNQVILNNITSMLRKRYNMYFSTIQVETECSDLTAKEIDFI